MAHWFKRQFGEDIGGFVELRVFPNGRGQMEAREWVKDAVSFCDFVNSFSGKDADTAVYFGPAIRHRKGGKKSDIAFTSVLWAEVDCEKIGWDCIETAKVLHSLPGMLQPSCCIHSGHGLHLYWYLNAPADDAAMIEGVNSMLRDMVSGDNVQDLSRVMRVPYSWNTKAKPIQARVVWQYHWAKHSITDIHDAVADFDRMLDTDGFIPRKTWEARDAKRRADATDPDKVYGVAYEDRRKTKNARGLSIWNNTRYGGGPGYVGLDEAIMQFTAWEYCRLTSPTPEKIERIVQDTLTKVREVHARDAAHETWNWRDEEVEVRQKLGRWIKKWDAIKSAPRRRV